MEIGINRQAQTQGMKRFCDAKIWKQRDRDKIKKEQKMVGMERSMKIEVQIYKQTDKQKK